MKIKMRNRKQSESLAVKLAPITLALASLMAASNAQAVLQVQCPGDTSGDDAVIDPTVREGGVIVGPEVQMQQWATGFRDPADGASVAKLIEQPANPADPVIERDIRCMHISASDGYTKMADGRDLYFFAFHRLTGTSIGGVPDEGQLRSNLPAPKIVGREGEELFLTLSNVGMALRPDLPDAHTVHYHGFPEASTIMDGVPDVSVSPNSMASMTYYYNLVEPGTYIYHCHFEATEHMQMGMIGNLWVEPKQNQSADGTIFGTHTHVKGDKYVYNDGDGSTHYDVEMPIQIVGFDGDFHDASEFITALPFASMNDEYPMINGRGYPDTVLDTEAGDVNGDLAKEAMKNSQGYLSQTMPSIVRAASGQKILLRVTNVSIINAFTLAAPGLTMELVGRGARIYRGANGENLHQKTSQVTVAGGDGFDVMIDTAGVNPGKYFLYSTNLNFLSNNMEDNGGIMTEIIIN